MSSTVYDNVYKTMLHTCTSLVLPLLNEVFGESYTGKENVRFRQQEHVITQPDKTKKIIRTDSDILILDDKKKYHMECQSTKDSNILVRFFEYDSQIAIDDAVLDDNCLTARFPLSSLLYLRRDHNIKEEMRINILTEKGSVEHPVHVLTIQDYTFSELLEKRLYFLIPFYIFNHEKRLKIYDNNPEELERLKEEYRIIGTQLAAAPEITDYMQRIIWELGYQVLEQFAAKYQNVKKGIGEVMGGHVIETETMILYRTAMTEGQIKGRMLQLIESICKKIHKNKSPEQIAEELEETQEKVKTIYDIAMKSAPDFDAEKIYQELQNGCVATE